MTYADLKAEWEGDAREISAHTSGSTGIPKQIMLSKKLIEASAWRTIKFFGLDHSSHLYSCISPDFIGGKMQAIRAWLNGAKFSYEEPSNFPKLGRDGDYYDLVSVVPSQMLNVCGRHEVLKRVRHWLVGGSAISPELREKISEKGISAWESYGMTETASHIAVRKIVADSNNGFNPMSGIKIRKNERGCLVIDQGMGGYIETNDLVDIHPDGSFHILGRYDNMIISGGRKILAEEVETCLNELSEYQYRYMVAGKPDAKWGEKLVVIVESEKEDQNEVEEIVRRSIEKIESHWKRPKEIIYVCKLLTTDNGKLKRKVNFDDVYKNNLGCRTLL